MRAIKTVDQEKKEKRQARRANRKAERALNSFNQPPKNSGGKFDDGLSGSCEAGNLTACKTKVKVMPKFNPKKRKISKKRLVKSKKETPVKQTNQDRYSNPRFL